MDDKQSDAMIGLMTANARIEAKLDSILDRIADNKEELKDHEERLRGLEKFKWKVMAIAVVIPLLISVYSSGLLDRLTGTPTADVVVERRTVLSDVIQENETFKIEGM